MRLSLCWFCKNAVPNQEEGTGCSWSVGFKPVSGWTASATTLCCHCGYGGTKCETRSFFVEQCPRFEPDADAKEIESNATQKRSKPYGVRKMYGIVNVTTGDRYDRLIDAAKWIEDRGLTTARAKIVNYCLGKKAKTLKEFKAYGYKWYAFEIGR